MLRASPLVLRNIRGARREGRYTERSLAQWPNRPASRAA
jgi:hypothetical protein